MKNRVISNDLDYIMENYFDTNKEVLYLCDYDTALEILQRGKYKKKDFEYFAVELDCQYPYYCVYKHESDDFIIEFLTKLDGSLYPEYSAEHILVQDRVLKKYDNIEDLFELYKEIVLVVTDKEVNGYIECCRMYQWENCNEEFCDNETTEDKSNNSMKIKIILGDTEIEKDIIEDLKQALEDSKLLF